MAIDEKENDTENRLEEREKPLMCQTLLNEFLFNLIHENQVCGEGEIIYLLPFLTINTKYSQIHAHH